jgi:hypothetical protein
MDLQTLTRDSWPSVALRSLGSFEQLFWLLDQDRPVHFGMVAQVAGDATPDQWRRALAQVQRRHPLLSAYIDTDVDGVPRFWRAHSAPIPLRTILGNPESDWHRVMELELVTPFDPEHAPLARAVLIQGDGRAAFMLLMHHSIGDALAAAYVIRDTLLALSGARLETLPVVPSQDELIGERDVTTPMQRRAERPARTTNATVRPPGGLAIPKVRSLRLPAAFTASLRARARDEGASVHGALCAALVVAGRQTSSAWRNIPVRIVSAIQTRTMQDVGDCCGCYLSNTTQSFEGGAASFWDLARLAKTGISRAREPESVNALVHAFQGLLAHGLDAPGATDFVATGLAREAMLSNIGELPFAGEFGRLKLEALWGPAWLGQFTEDQIVGAATIDGSLCLTLASLAPPEGLLETMQGTLAKACLA